MKSILTILALSAIANAHFVLQIPASLGFDDQVEDEGPCGSFKATDRSTGVTDWPVNGDAISLLTTHTHVTYDISAALLSDVTTFVPLLPRIDQLGVGTFCLPSVPGNAAWVGKDAVLQVIQNGPDGTLFQCAAIHFVAGSTDGNIPAGCSNSTGVSASFIKAPSASTSTSTTVVLSTTSSTSTLPPSSTSLTTPVIISTGSTSASATGVSTSPSVSKSSSTSAVAGSTSSAAITSKTTSTTSSNTTSATSTSAAQFTGGSNVLQSGSLLTLLGVVGAILAWGL